MREIRLWNLAIAFLFIAAICSDSYRKVFAP